MDNQIKDIHSMGMLKLVAFLPTMCKSNTNAVTQTGACFVRFSSIWVGQTDVRVRIFIWAGLTAQRKADPNMLT